MKTPEFFFGFDVGDREFELAVYDDKTCVWDDMTYRRSRTNESSRAVGLLAIADPDAAVVHERHRKAYSVTTALETSLYERLLFASHAAKSDSWTREDERRMDALILPYFREYVNPHLEEPVEL